MKSCFKEFENAGLSGLSNLGNTCFINATCQIISHTYELTKILKVPKHLNQCVETTFLQQWNDLRTIMYDENCTIRPAKFVHNVQTVAKHKNNEMFSDFTQNDVPEFFLFLVDCFHNAMKRKVIMRKNLNKLGNNSETLTMCFKLIKHECERGEYSEMIDLFYGIHLSQLQSLDAQTIYSVKAEQFNIINLAITDDEDNDFETLQECFEFYVQGEVLDGDNQWYNETENRKMVVQRTIRYWSLPQILVVDLKRYNERIQKTRTLIQFPLVGWDLTQYVHPNNPCTAIYDLYAICNHSGIFLGGHYTAMVLNANGQWYEIDDGCVSKVAETNLITPKAYCLFYRKRNK